MSIINTSNLAMDRKNKQQLKKFVSIVSDYEQSLNNKVDNLVSHVLLF